MDPDLAPTDGPGPDSPPFGCALAMRDELRTHGVDLPDGQDSSRRCGEQVHRRRRHGPGRVGSPDHGRRPRRLWPDTSGAQVIDVTRCTAGVHRASARPKCGVAASARMKTTTTTPSRGAAHSHGSRGTDQGPRRQRSAPGRTAAAGPADRARGRSTANGPGVRRSIWADRGSGWCGAMSAARSCSGCRSRSGWSRTSGSAFPFTLSAWPAGCRIGVQRHEVAVADGRGAPHRRARQQKK